MFKNFKTNKIMRLKLITFLIFIFINSPNLYTQTSLDIVRASNHYTKAISAYKSSSYKTALIHLKNAETNLKGKTNKDLEYLKIMTFYKLKNYKKAYGLIQVYFEKGYPKNRIQYFKNIESYRKKYNISYDKMLTNIFIELEDKYGIVTNTSIEEVISAIIKRISAKKKNLSDIIKYNTYEEVKISSRKYTPVDTYNNKRRSTWTKKYGTHKNTYWFNRRISTDNKIKFICNNNSWYKKFVFSKKTYLNTRYYEYDYIIKNSSTYISYNQIKLKRTKNWYNNSSGRSSYNEMKKMVYDDLKSKYNNKKFLKNSDYGKFKISFTETEKLILQQQGNMEKLKVALRKKLLL